MAEHFLAGLLVIKHFHFSLNLEKILVLIFFLNGRQTNFGIVFNIIIQGFYGQSITIIQREILQ